VDYAVDARPCLPLLSATSRSPTAAATDPRPLVDLIKDSGFARSGFGQGNFSASEKGARVRTTAIFSRAIPALAIGLSASIDDQP